MPVVVRLNPIFNSGVLLPYGQVGIGTKGGLEAAVHTVWNITENHDHEETLCSFKVDMKNVFN